ncbi:MAG: putative ATP-binding protein involved in virulence [Alteromonadaceae bacterium]|jgi:predicted ATP-binding protein involved in virulence/transcriptional regulator with XRE-family HTH domain
MGQSNPWHSGTRLQRLRELEGLEQDVLALELAVEPPVLAEWEREGIPESHIESLCHYFEVSRQIFTDPVDSNTSLERLVRRHLFGVSEAIDELAIRLQTNKATAAPALDLSRLGLTTLPDELFEHTWLTELKLADNKLDRLPSALVLLDKLATLDISDNLITQIPGVVANLPYLAKLNYSGNPFSKTWAVSNNPLEGLLKHLEDQPVTITVTTVVEQPSLTQYQQIDELAKQIEPTTTLLVCNPQKLNTHLSTVSVSCLIQLTLQTDAAQIVAECETVLPVIKQHRLPLIMHSTAPISATVREQIHSLWLTALPDSSFLLFLSDNSSQLKQHYQQIQNRIHYQQKIPRVRLKRLVLCNIGVYQNLEIEFKDRVTTLIGLNGAGKTTILKALALAIVGPKHGAIDPQQAGQLLRITGKKEGQPIWDYRGSITLDVYVNGIIYSNCIELSNNLDTEAVDITGQQFKALFKQDNQLVNLILGLGEQRNINASKQANVGLGQKQAKVRDLLPILKSQELACTAHFTDWIGSLEFEALKGKIENRQLISVTFDIFSQLMHEPIRFVELKQIDPVELWVEHQNPKQLVPFQLASQGYQAVMGWVGFIVKRLFEAYEFALDPLHCPAIIMIDEIDQLLHVKWQQRILDILTERFFPNIQWIITTHSPVVIAGLDQEQVIQLHNQNDHLVAENSPADLWLWQYGDVMRYLFELIPPEPKISEQDLLQKIATLEQQQAPHTQLDKLRQQLQRVQESRAFVDKVYAEQQRLHQRERQLQQLIDKLKPSVKD